MRIISILIILLMTNLPKTYSQTITLPRDVVTNMKKWADASQSFKQERDSIASELSLVKKTIVAKDTLINLQDRQLDVMSKAVSNNYELYSNEKKQNDINSTLVTYWKDAEKRQRHGKTFFQTTTGVAAAAIIYLLIKK